jgi:phenylacetic acid degradation operon negative regulatory protein
MANARLGELRPDTWLRPANLAGPAVEMGTIVVRGPVEGEAADALARRLWNLDAIAARCAGLLEVIEDGSKALVERPAASIPRAIIAAAAVIRFLRAEPLLPRVLTPPDWPVDRLRRRYAEFDRAFGRALRQALDQPLP